VYIPRYGYTHAPTRLCLNMSRTIKQLEIPQFPSDNVGSTVETVRVGDSPGPANYPFLLPPIEADEIGRLGNYRVLRLLGQGGMGYVFQAEDDILRRPVALKVMKPQFHPDDDACDRFLREARLMASIKHDHVVMVFQVGKQGRTPYLAMELLQGKPLDEWMKQGPKIGVPAVLRLGRQIAAGLAVIHGHGLIHRDIKPANIWLESPKSRVKILDFGLARLAEDDTRLTLSGMIVGTPSYMSPEQARGEPLDARSDLFSLGCLLYELCSGLRPFHASTTMAVLTALATKAPRPVHELRLNAPKELSDLVMRLLAKAPAERPASAEEVAAELQRIEGQLNGRSTARAPTLPTREKLPTRVKTATRMKKFRPARERQSQKLIVIGLVIGVVVLGGALATGLTILLWPSSAHQNAPPATSTQAPPALATMYLSDWKPIDDRNPIKAPPPPMGVPAPPFSFGVRVRDQLSPHGIFMHPPMQPNGGDASLSYRLAGKYRQFMTEMSLNDGPPESETPLTFSVFGDGKLLWRSHPVRRQADADHCMISVKGVDVLTIQVSCPGEPRGAHAVWIEPRVAP
jgi:eukaryotic-like serine/threonine-protein kinase